VSGAMTIGVMCVTASGAFAQVGGEASWLWEVSTQNGDSIVEPGETPTITLSIDMRPDAMQGGPVLGFGGVVFDTFGSGGALQGAMLDWSVLNDLDNIGGGDTTTSDGVSLFGTAAGQDPLLPSFLHDDPIGVLSFEWATDDFSQYEVMYETMSLVPDQGEHVIIVWEGTNGFDATPHLWPIEEALISFQVVPAPASAVVVGLSVIAAGCRRRH